MRERRAGAAVALVVAMVAAALAGAGCTGRAPVTVSRRTLGTVVTISAWGADEPKVRAACDTAFREMERVSGALDPYDESSAIAAFNRDPYEWHELPADALVILDAVNRLHASRDFAVGLWGVTRLYHFETSGTVPATETLAGAVAASRGLERDGRKARFVKPDPGGADAWTGDPPGLDFGGAAKGLALDRARDALRKNGAVEAAVVSAGSSTVTLGRKPDGEPWRIGIEDPRDTGRVVAVVSDSEGGAALSTSGDYQTYFTQGGTRFHHILDPRTGRPARGTRSLTVFGSISGLDSDILSTSLFVAGPKRAAAEAQRSGYGIYIVEERGHVLSAGATSRPGIRLTREAAPKQ